MNWIKKNYGNVLWGLFIVLLFIPQTGTPIKVFINRLIAFSPSVEAVEDRKTLEDYQWQLRDLDGRVVNFQEFKGKKVVVNFWATWCPPCIAEMPSMQALYNDYKDKAVFVFVTNDDREAIDKFISKRHFQIPIYQALSSAPALLEGNSLPTTYLIDESGAILIEKTGAADWNSDKVRALLE
ncbi:TlpA family protein disulfide reductase [Arcticibacterium luteifluviistationis]|uniref:Thiol-disulfide oxidoreductase n=1 Tax=Arcticibacterium luteifluviistationis TaxID=1784714 RepID=A0A2Z4G7M6_9BACT|nr:TlpA disulfide reductase family protein [Arcticibacterium luteifluviistationis]AWV97068.1 thiol-disulfide oxidoreductase [Arcticibacterium luteifluviistationis]